MPQLSTSKTYADGDILFESDLDQIRTDIETFLNVTQIDDENIQDSGITGSTKLVDATVTTAKLAASSVTTTKLDTNAVTDAKLRQSAGLSVIGRSANTTGDVADITAGTDAFVLRRSGTSIGFGTVATDGIANSAVTTAKINDAAVTQAKRAALGQQVSSSCGSFSTTSTSYTDITNLSITITTTGRPILLMLTPDGDTSNVAVIAASAAAVSAGAQFKLLRDATAVGLFNLFSSGGGSQASVNVPSSSIIHFDVPSSGTYTYKLQVKAQTSATTATVGYSKLVAFEL